MTKAALKEPSENPDMELEEEAGARQDVALADTGTKDLDRPRDERKPDNLLQAIFWAMSDPTVDTDRINALIDIQVRLEDREAEKAFAAALPAMLADIPVIEAKKVVEGTSRSGASIGRRKYAPWEDIDPVIKPILSRHGFGLTFEPGVDGDFITMTAILTHSQGHSRRATIRLPRDSGAGKNELQAIGSTFSYGKRYSASVLIDISTKGEDDDAMSLGTITAQQFVELEKMMEDLDIGADRVCNYATRLAGFDVQAITEIPTQLVDKIVKKMTANAQQAKPAAAGGDDE